MYVCVSVNLCANDYVCVYLNDSMSAIKQLSYHKKGCFSSMWTGHTQQFYLAYAEYYSSTTSYRRQAETQMEFGGHFNL